MLTHGLATNVLYMCELCHVIYPHIAENIIPIKRHQTIIW
jgi:hypothetical protein